MYDWRVLVVKCSFMPFSYDFLVIPIKKNDKAMNDKRLTKSYKSHNEPYTKLTLFSCAWRCLSKLQVIQSLKKVYKWYKVYLSYYCCASATPYLSYQYTQTHTVFLYFLDFPHFLIFILFYWKQ